MSKSSKGKPSSFKGKTHSASANRKNRLAHLGKKASEETKRKMREAAKRRNVTITWKANISKGLKGKKKSRQHRKKLSEARKGIEPWNKGKKGVMPIPWNKGKKHKDSTNRKNRRWHLGKKASAETRKKMSLLRKGKLTGKNNPMYGKTHSIKSVRQYQRTMKKKYPDGFKMTEQQKKKIAMKYKPQKPAKNTSIEKIIQKLCRQKKIKFQTQKRFEFENPPPHYHSVDLFIQPNICIECDGDRFHANPKNYRPNSIIYKAYKSKNHHREKPLLAKHIWAKDKHITQELRKQGNRVIRFWGSKITNDPEKCIQKILNTIKKSK